MLSTPSLSPVAPDGALGRDIQNKIGQQLRAVYDEVVKEGIPDRFAQLLKQLEKPTRKDEGGP